MAPRGRESGQPPPRTQPLERAVPDTRASGSQAGTPQTSRWLDSISCTILRFFQEQILFLQDANDSGASSLNQEML